MQVGDIVILSQENWRWHYIHQIFVLESYDGDDTALNIDGFRWEISEFYDTLGEKDKVVKGSSLARRLLCK